MILKLKETIKIKKKVQNSVALIYQLKFNLEITNFMSMKKFTIPEEFLKFYQVFLERMPEF